MSGESECPMAIWLQLTCRSTVASFNTSILERLLVASAANGLAATTVLAYDRTHCTSALYFANAAAATITGALLLPWALIGVIARAKCNNSEANALQAQLDSMDRNQPNASPASITTSRRGNNGPDDWQQVRSSRKLSSPARFIDLCKDLDRVLASAATREFALLTTKLSTALTCAITN